MDSYGGFLLLEYGTVFKALYTEKKVQELRNNEYEDLSEKENSKIDICMCISVLLATS
jgi:hypothetical protein